MEENGFGWEWLTTAAGGGLGAALGYIARILFDRKRKVAEDKGAELDADTKAVELYERFANQLNPRIEALQLKQDELTNTVNNLRIENANLKITNAQLVVENKVLQEDMHKMKAENGALKEDIRRLHDELNVLRNQM